MVTNNVSTNEATNNVSMSMVTTHRWFESPVILGATSLGCYVMGSMIIVGSLKFVMKGLK